MTSRRILAVALGGMLLAPGSCVLWMHRVGERRWAEMERAVRGLEAERAARSAARPVLRGTARPGDAWEDYAAAAEALGDVESYRSPWAELWAFIDRKPGADPGFVAALLETHREAIERFRQGASRSSGRARIDWANLEGTAERRVYTLGRLLEARARLHIEAGRVQEALDDLLDLAQAAGDVVRDGDLYASHEGLWMMGGAFDGLRALAGGGGMSSDQHRALASALELLEARLPDFGETARNEAMGLGLRLMSSGTLPRYHALWPPSDVGMPWYVRLKGALWPGRLSMADAWHFEWELREAEIAAEGGPWPAASQAHRTYDRIWRKSLTRMGPVHGTKDRSMGGTDRVFRARRVQLRLLRLAAVYGATAQVPSLEDPFGGVLRHAVRGGRLRLWSVGPDGVDDGGADSPPPSWRPPPPALPGDIVLDVPARVLERTLR